MIFSPLTYAVAPSLMSLDVAVASLVSIPEAGTFTVTYFKYFPLDGVTVPLVVIVLVSV